MRRCWRKSCKSESFPVVANDVRAVETQIEQFPPASTRGLL